MVRSVSCEFFSLIQNLNFKTENFANIFKIIRMSLESEDLKTFIDEMEKISNESEKNCLKCCHYVVTCHS